MRYWLFIFILLSSFGYAGDKIVKVTTLPDYAPFCEANGKYKVNQIIKPGEDTEDFYGYSWDVLRESYHAMGYTIDLSIRPWSRAMRDFKDRKVDILFPAGVNSERKKIFDYSQESINKANFLIYVKADNPIEWNGLESFAGKTVSMKREFNYGDLWNKNRSINKYEVSTILQGFKMLNANRFDGLLGYEYNWDYVLKQQGWKDRFRKLPSFDSTAEYLVTLKSNPNAKNLLKVFDSGKKQLIKNGRLEEIKKKWFGD